MAEGAWNSQYPVNVSKAYSENTEWRNRNQFISGRDEVQQFLANKGKRTGLQIEGRTLSFSG